MVEVPGIEPGSFGTDIGLLRAYCVYRFLSSGSLTHKYPTNSFAKLFSEVVRKANFMKSLLSALDPSPKAERWVNGLQS